MTQLHVDESKESHGVTSAKWAIVQHRHPPARGLLSLISLLRAFLLTGIKRNQAGLVPNRLFSTKKNTGGYRAERRWPTAQREGGGDFELTTRGQGDYKEPKKTTEHRTNRARTTAVPNAGCGHSPQRPMGTSPSESTSLSFPCRQLVWNGSPC